MGQELNDGKISIRIRCLWDSPVTVSDIAEPIYRTWQYERFGWFFFLLRQSMRWNFSRLDFSRTLVANTLITDELSTVSGK